jgi:hypothetical protein
MTIRLIPIAATAIALAACSPGGRQTAGYAYPAYWGTSPAEAPGRGAPAYTETIAATHDIPGSVAVFNTHSTPAPGTWLFPPNPYQ